MPVLIVIIVFFALAAFLKSPSGKGWLGEFAVNIVLGHNKQGVKYKVNNFTFKFEDKTVQIDHLFINKNGIFVIETKNYRGRVYGDEKSQEWAQVFNYGKSKFKMYNPIRQNKSHIYHLKQLLEDYNVDYHSVIVFFDNTTKYIKSETPVIQVPHLRKLIKKTKSNKQLSPNEIDAIYNFIISYRNNNVIRKRTHVKNVKTRLKKLDENICPRCNGNLVEKKGKYGTFMGCENYPKCKFIKRL
jgi:hypothetical protein